MIPVPAWLTLRLVGVVAGVAAVAFAGYRVNTWHTSHGLLRAAEKRLEAEEGCEPGSKCAARVAAAETAAVAKQIEIDAEVLSGYQTGLETVAAYAAAHPAPSVRLCKPAGRTSVRVPVAAQGADGGPAPGDVPLETSSDIGQRLFDLADEADREAVKLRWLQEWSRALAAD